MSRVIYTCLFSNYEEVKEPKIVTHGWKYILFTDQNLVSNGWEVRKVDLNGFDPQLMARYYKIMEWVDWKESMWIDGSFVIDTDLNIWWDKNFKKGFAAPGHPLRNCVYNECLDCIIAKRGNKEQVQAQMEEYKELGVPAGNGLIQSGILMRENTPEVIKLCEAWYRELSTHSIRDQIAFCKVSLGSDVVHTYQFDYRQGKDFIYHHHFINRGGAHIPMSKY